MRSILIKILSYPILSPFQMLHSFVRRVASSSLPSSRSTVLILTFSRRLMGAANCKNGQEFKLCELSDIPKTGGMKECKVGEDGKGKGGGTVLVVRDGKGWHAVGPKCTHFGAKLVNGALSTAGGRIRCPWHGACFSYRTGDIEDFPGFDSLPKYQVDVRSDGVYLVVPPNDNDLDLGRTKRVQTMCKKEDAFTADPIVIIGAGSGGVSCAERLRQNCYTGSITLLTQESCLPYDRTKLSKAPNAALESLQLRESDFFNKYDIDLKLDSKVSAINTDEKTVTLASGNSPLSYSSLVIATGGKPRLLNATGVEKFGSCIHYLRTPEDGKRIANDAAGKNVLVVGTSFIGMEIAAYMVSQKADVTVLSRSDNPPFYNSFGSTVGKRIQQLFEEKGVKYVVGVIDEVIGDEAMGQLNSVKLTDGNMIDTQLVLVGIGVSPSLDFLPSTITRDPSGYVRVDGQMKTNVENVYAVGDVCAFPLGLSPNTFPTKPINVQHWAIASKQGQTAGDSISEKNQPIKSVPFFWSQMFGKSFRFTGVNRGWQAEVLHGSLDDLKFANYYFDKELAASDCLFIKNFNLHDQTDPHLVFFQFDKRKRQLQNLTAEVGI